MTSFGRGDVLFSDRILRNTAKSMGGILTSSIPPNFLRVCHRRRGVPDNVNFNVALNWLVG